MLAPSFSDAGLLSDSFKTNTMGRLSNKIQDLIRMFLVEGGMFLKMVGEVKYNENTFFCESSLKCVL